MSRAVGEHDVEARDDVLDLPVARRQLTGAAAREPAADGRQRDRLRPVPDVTPCSARSSSSNTSPNVPGSTSTIIDVVSTSTMPASRGEVEQHAAEHRHARAAHAAAPAAAVTGTRASLQTRRIAPHLFDRAAAGRRRSPAPRPGRRAPRSSRAATSRGSPRRRLVGASTTSAPVAASRARSASSTSTRLAAEPVADRRGSTGNAIGGVGAPRFVSIAIGPPRCRRSTTAAAAARRARSRAGRRPPVPPRTSAR